MPASLSEVLTASDLYLTWRLDLPQTFTDRLVAALAGSRDGQRRGALVASVTQAVTPRLATYFAGHAVTLAPDEVTSVAALGWSGAEGELRFVAAETSATRALEALPHVPATHPLRARLEASAAAAATRDGKTRDAIKILEDAMARAPGEGEEAAAQRSADALTLGRLYFQTADLAKAESWYAQVSPESRDAATAHEELAWTWLRRGDTSRLRGVSATLASSLFAAQFLPELHVIRAVSDLKLCLFDEAKAEITTFVSAARPWAAKIQAALKAETPEAPPLHDAYADRLARAIDARQAEKAQLGKLLEKSITAATPAVGRQDHWRVAGAALEGHLARLGAEQLAQRRRQWRNAGAMLSEAIRKMRFVKVELASQLRGGIVAHPTSATSAETAAAAAQKLEDDADGRLSFPLDGALWSDEVFATRSTAASVCL
jgi:hypothetical protein